VCYLSRCVEPLHRPRDLACRATASGISGDSAKSALLDANQTVAKAAGGRAPNYACQMIIGAGCEETANYGFNLGRFLNKRFGLSVSGAASGGPKPGSG